MAALALMVRTLAKLCGGDEISAILPDGSDETREKVVKQSTDSSRHT
jgi:hypothetical protein